MPAKRRGDVLRRWWHEIQRLGGRYSCYAIFLVLPSDREAIRYLHEFGKELDLISGEDCLVVEFDDPLLSGGVGPQVPMTQDWTGLQEPWLAEDCF
ncbi:MAG: hypothetical protein AABZ58_14795, partial [Chloroflexota bacterium]